MPDVLVLCYHGVSDTWPADTAVRESELREHLQGFLRKGYRGQTFTTALMTPSDRRVLSVTFDDAPRSVLEKAWPVLSDLGIVGTVFVPTSYATSQKPMGWQGQEKYVDGPHVGELRCMTWEQLSELSRAGWEVGSHTCNHPRLSTLDDATLTAELALSREEIESRLSTPCESLAYPYGDHDPRVVEAARAAGYRVAATAPAATGWREVPGAPLPLQWPRVSAYRGDSGRTLRARVWRRQVLESSAAGRLAADTLGGAVRAIRAARA